MDLYPINLIIKDLYPLNLISLLINIIIKLMDLYPKSYYKGLISFKFKIPFEAFYLFLLKSDFVLEVSLLFTITFFYFYEMLLFYFYYL